MFRAVHRRESAVSYPWRYEPVACTESNSDGSLKAELQACSHALISSFFLFLAFQFQECLEACVGLLALARLAVNPGKGVVRFRVGTIQRSSLVQFLYRFRGFLLFFEQDPELV